MHKDGNCKEVMKKIKQQWGTFDEEKIFLLQQSYEARERKVIKKFKMPREEWRWHFYHH